jgi:hypothetical protein
MESYNLSFETEDLKKDLENSKNFIIDKNKKSWLKNYPNIISDIDIQLRKFFDINEKRRLVFSIYQLEEGLRSLQIHPQNYNVVDRIIISSVDDQMKTSKGEKLNMKSWEACYIPKKFKQNTDIYFDNSSTFKKNNVKIKRDKKDRYIMVFEYFFNKNELTDITSFFEKDNTVDDMVNDFLN